MSNRDPNKFVLHASRIFLIVIPLLILGCNTTSLSETPQTEPVGVTPKSEAIVEQQTPLIKLTLVIDPPDAAVPLFNPTPLSENDLRFLFGEVVTINVIPQPGWKVKEWVGPVINKGRNKAQVIMDGSQSIGVSLVSETQIVSANPTVIVPVPAIVQDMPTPYPTYTPYPTPTLVPTPYPTYTPYPTPTSVPTPYPTYTPYPTPTSVPTPYPTYTPYPTPTSVPTPYPTPTKALVAQSNSSCPSGSDSGIGLVNFSFSPTTISSTGSPTLELSYQLTTTGSGIDYIDTSFTSPGGDYSASIGYENMMEWGYNSALVSGTPNDGTYKLTWDMSWIDLEGKEGIWNVGDLRVTDMQSDKSEEHRLNTLFSSACLKERGFNIQLVVVP